MRTKEVQKSLWDKEAMRERGVLVCESVSSQRPEMDGPSIPFPDIGERS